MLENILIIRQNDVTFGDFLASFLGLNMTNTKTYSVTKHIPCVPLPKTAGAFLWHFTKRHGKAFGMITFLMMFWSANEALYPYFIKLFVDAIVGYTGEETIPWDVLKTPFWAVVISFTVMEIAMRTMGLFMLYTLPKFRADMRMQVMQYVKGHSLSYFTNNFAGTIATRIHDIPRSADTLMENILDHVFAIVMAFIFSSIILSFVSPLFTVMMIVWCAFHMGVTFYFMPELRQKSKAHANAVSRMQGDTVDCITNMTAVRLFAKGSQELKRLVRSQNKEIEKSIIAGWAYEKVNMLRGLGGIAFIVSVIFLLVRGYQEQWVSVGDFPLVAMTIFTILSLIWHLSMNMQALFKDLGTISAGLALLNTPHEVNDLANAKPLSVTQGRIDVKDLRFSYRKKTPLFKELNLNIKAGESVGLVGFSGSGKTTFVNLLLRFFEAQKGSILIDGQDITRVTQDSLRANIAMIPQDPSLFHRSLMDNIRYGKEGASDEEVIQASKLAHCHDFIKELEDGYETLVGERGLKLSGGQRQRIAIARAILKDAPILVLDEATSALDSVTEKYIQESLQKIMKGRTTIVVAHRLSTLASVDRIVVFDNGEILEQGSQKDLLKNKSGAFSQLWVLQNEGFLPDKRT